MRTVFISLMICASTLLGFAQKTDVLTKLNKQYFIENKGQWNSDVLYLCRMGGLDVWITKYGVNYTFYKIEKDTKGAKEKTTLIPDKFNHEDIENGTLLGHRVLMKLQNYNPNPKREGKQKQNGYYNYFIGNDPSKHANYVSLYKEAVIKDIYNGIDLRYYFDKGSLRYDYIVHPEADPNQIAFALEGQNNAFIKDGNLCFSTRFGEVMMAELRTYQGKNTIQSHFEKQDNIWKIALGEYDKTKDLIIDPLIFSTYIGGNDNDYIKGIAVDSLNDVYITGQTYSTDYDITPGSFQQVYQNIDIFVTKLNSLGDSLIYSTYVGGYTTDASLSLVVDALGNAYIAAYTNSSNLYITNGAFQSTIEGPLDAFVFKLNAFGSAIIYSTYIGGSNGDYATDIAIDLSGNAYITGHTNSTNYDITPNCYQSTFEGIEDVFITKLNSTGTNLIYSTYIGGSGVDKGFAIAIDNDGYAYITGYTESTNYDVTSLAYQTSNGGQQDAFMTKINTTGTSLVYSTYIGGTGNDVAYDIAATPGLVAYITGSTESSDFDVTTGAFQTSLSGGEDAFVTKISTLFKWLVYSTYIGGGNYEYGRSIKVDNCGNAYILGSTSSTNYDITPDAYQTTCQGYDAFITKLNPTATSIIYSTYIGGDNYENISNVALDNDNNVYIVGYTQSTNFDTTAGSYQTQFEGGLYDGFISKLNILSATLFSSQGTDNQSACVNSPITNITYKTEGVTNVTFNGLPNGVNGNFSNQTILISGVPTVVGTYNYTITITDGCNTKNITGTITVMPPISASLASAATDNQTICIYTSLTDIVYTTAGVNNVVFSGLPSGVYGVFNGDSIIISGIPNVSGPYNYSITLTGPCGTQTLTGVINVTPENQITLTSGAGSNNQTVCINTSISNIIYTISGASGVNVSGLPTGVSATFVSGVLIISGTPTEEGEFSYIVNLQGACGSTMGTITVNPNSTVTLNSAAGTDSQTVCINTPINNIIYTTSGATGATVSGLPAGVNATYVSGVILISGTPTESGTFEYTISLTGGCGNITQIGTIIVSTCNSINNPQTSTNWQIYPNPNNGQFVIETVEPGEFELMDVTGKKWNTYKIESTRCEVIDNLPAGVYTIRNVESGMVKKMIIK